MKNKEIDDLTRIDNLLLPPLTVSVYVGANVGVNQAVKIVTGGNRNE
jgi:hypothetical protein